MSIGSSGMVNVRQRGEQLRRFILDNIQHHPSDIDRVAPEKFGITRQAVNKHLDRLVNEGAVVAAGTTRSCVYRLDERHSVLELAKGKFTTDPDNHTGEGIFFTSRVLDEFIILSGGVYFSHGFEDDEDWILESENPSVGTAVRMRLHNHAARTTRSIFDQYTSEDTLAFTKTVVPVKLAQYGDESLLSRSQAKRLLARIDRFRAAIFDFRGVASIGPSFADEIFRVFQNEHPDISLSDINATPEVSIMITRARATRM